MNTKQILHNRISETQYNVELSIIDGVYMVKYGHQVETYDLTPIGLTRACAEYLSCVDHVMRCEEDD
jgi:hypothetical protein